MYATKHLNYITTVFSTCYFMFYNTKIYSETKTTSYALFYFIIIILSLSSSYLRTTSFQPSSLLGPLLGLVRFILFDEMMGSEVFTDENRGP